MNTPQLVIFKDGSWKVISSAEEFNKLNRDKNYLTAISFNEIQSSLS